MVFLKMESLGPFCGTLADVLARMQAAHAGKKRPPPGIPYLEIQPHLLDNKS
jgi:hypothetical protein